LDVIKEPYFVRINNLDGHVTEKDIIQYFSDFDIVDVKIVRNFETRESRRFGFIELNNPKDVVDILVANGSVIYDKNIEVVLYSGSRKPNTIFGL